MKKRLILGLLMAMLGLSSCGSRSESNIVYVSVYPIYDFASRIGGERFEIRNITPYGMEPHDFEPSARLMVSICEGKGFLVNGLNMEHYVSSLPREVQEKTYCVTSDIETIKENGVEDPHVWLDPLRAKKEAENIKDFFISIDSANKGEYETNFALLEGELQALHEEFSLAVECFDRKTIVTSHSAFGYFCARYGLTQVSVNGLEPDEEPSAQDLSNILKIVEESGVTTIFTEEMVSSEIAERIARETGAKVDVLSPLEGLKEEDIGKEDYFSIMKDNMERLKRACCD